MSHLENSYIVFVLGRTKYALSARHVRHLEMMHDITPVPGVLKHVLGVVSLRGQVIPVLSLRRLFGMDSIEPERSARLIVVEEKNRSVALLVDSAREFLVISPEEVVAPPPSLEVGRPSYLEGLVTQEESVILLLNLSQLLSVKEPSHVE